MHLRSWHVLSLPKFECYLPPRAGIDLAMGHLGTAVQPEPLADGRRIGDTTWGMLCDGQLMAVSWDWIEILPGAVCMVDPGNVLTNIRFMDSQGCYEEPSQALLSVNVLIHRTPWQATVCAALDNALPSEITPSLVGRSAYALAEGLRRAA
jgi:hypothetical protein